MTYRTAFIGFVASAILFGSCCVVMLGLGHHLRSPTIVYGLMAVWAASAFAWPVFFIEVVKTAFAARRRRRRPR